MVWMESSIQGERKKQLECLSSCDTDTAAVALNSASSLSNREKCASLCSLRECQAVSVPVPFEFSSRV